ncbi:hypothetical protein CLM85_18570 [Streptomyces albidoflavus]|uniref:hypothetical protein n=1 Tax=Streptomyces albidoflavus TaxID=1886 RepID=UPI000BADDE5A|nr:hypothetical protein [Streptomyces albidoflavus]PAX92709.1 hypothetical protein CLM82_01700 [Streptomyces albidoflavus]PBO17715.1 hypothetical protein CLM83_16445 [Streptomyces albidoflavus]PBO23030.1 hypothetical protein CLM85_18570 [Streptomyces albidoflavus]PBO30980.1 hypothetical protein CLM84_05300 [Streptomyces albidoflavus]
MAVLPSLVTVAELAALLGRTFTPAQEAQAQALLDQASSVVRAYVRQDLTRATSTLTVSMRRADPVLHRCGGLVTLPQRPVVDVASVSVDGVSTQDWWQEGQEILLRSGAWSSPPTAHRPPQVTVTYTHGFDPVPGDIKAIVAQAANRVMVNPGAVRSETVGGESVTYLIPATGEALGVLLSRTEQRVLDRYRRTSGTVQVRGR